jgi:hypothetical protein
VGVTVGVGDALCVGVGVTVGLEEGDAVTVTLAVTVAVTVAVAVAVAVAVDLAVTVCVTVARGGLGEMQTTWIRLLPSAPALTGFSLHEACLVVAWTVPTMAPTTSRTAVRAAAAARVGVMGPSSV